MILSAAIVSATAWMRDAAANMDFELAAQLRDQLFEVRARKDNAAKAKTAAGTARGGR